MIKQQHMSKPPLPANEGSTARSTRLIPIGAAWLLGTFIYFASVLDGFESLIFQPIIASVVSGICVAGACLAGVLLRLSPWGKFWCSSFWWAGGFSAASLVVLLFG
jgi:hypothetical protein